MNYLSRRAVLASLATLAVSPASAQRTNPPRFETAARQFTQISPPRAVPPLRLRGLDGKTSELSAQRGGITLINLWATWCPACVNELPVLERLHTSNQGVRVVAISVDREGGRERVARYLTKLNVKRLPVYLDPEGDVAYSDRENVRKAPFALYGMPISYIADGGGRIVGYFPGEADWLGADAQRLFAYYRGE